jgi:mannosyltransferase
VDTIRYGAAVAAATTATGLGLVASEDPSAWYDEAATVAAIDRSPVELVDMLWRVDAVHGLYYLAAMAWSALVGSSLVSLRALSAVGLGVAAGLVVLLAQRFTSATTAILAGFLAAIIPGLAWSALEARGYSWSAALAVLSGLTLLRAVEWSRQRDWVAYAAAIALGVWFFAYLALLVPAHGFAVALARRDRLSRWWPAALAGLGAASPLLVLAWTQSDQVAWIDVPASQLLQRVAVNQSFAQIREEDAAGGASALLVPACVCLALVTAVVCWSGVRRGVSTPPSERFGVALCLAWMLVPTVLIAGATLTGLQLYQERYLTFTVPAVVLVTAVGLTSWGVRTRAVAALGIVLLALPAFAHHRSSNPKFDDFRRLARSAAVAQPDAVVFSPSAARGVATTYPGEFPRAEDLSLAESPRRSGTLHGTSARPRSLTRLRVAGRTLLLVGRTGAVNDPWALRLSELRCVPEPTPTVDARYTVTTYNC